MIITNYDSFRDNLLLNENLQAAKIWLRKKALDEEKKRMPGLKISLQDIDNIEDKSKVDREFAKIKNIALRIKNAADDNKDFQNIKRILLKVNKPGLGFLFTKFRIEEGLPIEDIEDMLKQIIDLSQYLNKLPMPLDKYTQLTPSVEDHRPASERLLDDLNELSKLRATDKFIQRLPGQFIAGEDAPDKGKVVPSLKDAFRNAPDAVKKIIQNIAIEFEKLGTKNNVLDPEKNKSLQDQFFSNIKRWRTVEEVIKNARRHIQGEGLQNEMKYLEEIEKANNKFGKINGCDIVYYKNGILIMHIKSWQANNLLNSDTSHCIAEFLWRWVEYVSKVGIYNNQYYIRDFNKTPDDNLSVIGLTISPEGKPSYAHLKDNSNFKSEVVEYVKSLGLDFKSIFKPMTNKQIQEKKKRDDANQEIIKSNIKTDRIKELLDLGADPNASNGKPLSMAISEVDYEKVEFLLNNGALASIGKPLDLIANKSSKEAGKIINLMIKRGAEINTEIFDLIIDEPEILEDILASGKFQVDQKDGLALRRAALIGTEEHHTSHLTKKQADDLSIRIIKLLIDYGANLAKRDWYILKSLAEFGRVEVMDFVLKEAKKANLQPHTEVWNRVMWFAKSSDEIDDQKKSRMILYIKNNHFDKTQ